jgi:broad specificity phosphatase PhoE
VRLRRGPEALWLVRHGESQGNLLREAAERESRHEIGLPTRDADVPLSDRGEEQARAFGRWLAAQPAELRPTTVLVLALPARPRDRAAALAPAATSSPAWPRTSTSGSATARWASSRA